MKKYLYGFFFPLLLFTQDLEVRLPTQGNLPPLYLSSLGGAEEMRAVLEFDLSASGRCIVLPRQEDLEKNALSFSLANWKRAHIPYCVTGRMEGGKLELTVYQIDQGTVKKYPNIPLERKAVHKLADQLQKDLFGRDGIARFQLIYTERRRNLSKEGLDFLSEIWIADYDGANAKQVTSENSYCLSPGFLPHSCSEFYYASEKTGQTKLYKASLSHPIGEPLLDLRGNQALPSISKDGKQIAFISDVAGRPDLFIQDLENGKIKGKAKQLFSYPRATQATPTYSPDGKQIAFVSDKDGPPRIYVLAVSQKKSKTLPQPKLLTKKNRENTSPAWSPDGTKLAYSAKVDSFRQIWIYDFLTGEEIALTTGPENKENPSWAPDSFHLIYNTETNDHSELYLIHLNRKEPILVGKSIYQRRFASWQLF
ncbi:MAG: hypothetical protein ACD_17C00298G0002 [uncultured bacterium]|nr:MAG: hypothetical protein ACD_17C00298G0002 [uncultured bacterium]OGN56687.1 MAG: hypothetical protein A2796_03925 [Chlamydiae bacterium RIFCSPHIGHO2_01_FULL_44_39]OGN58031.1 MAG: hypothetical protein A3C42_02655 [Chlamydiae bacterium RIFCSPHIGHO2_02_FULL_45_9]OGN61195.1 MAG: hypothetical protein A3D96_06100 [Chlamydiae bacterium RIFCSPHIGHO2_12_FULL_44_59]OGN65665.1 MAG: hypothetical protein A2978_06905 [Chlamydiae bacterium RIFCSPLOWO2_01_FULL_44_52]OGN68142.1 MAG: hypothetical protein A3